MKSKSENETLAQIRRLGLWRENEEKEILDFIEELGLILVDVHKNELIDEKEKKPPAGPDYSKGKARPNAPGGAGMLREQHTGARSRGGSERNEMK